MISKQDFLRAVQTEIFPILRQHQEKIERKTRFIKKRLPLLLVFSFTFLFLSIMFLSVFHIINSEQTSFMIFLLIVLSIVLGIGCLISVSCYCDHINDIIKPRVFSLLGLGKSDTDESSLRELSNTGIFPYFNDEMVDDSFAVPNTKHSLLVQEVDLERSSDEHSRCVFVGIVISANQLRHQNLSLLMLDKKNRPNRSKTELTNKFISKLSGVKFQWQKVEDKFLNKEFSFYTDNPELCRKYLTPTFLSVIEKLKAGDEEPLNILFHNGKIFLAISTKRNFFECIDWDDLLDIEPYAQLYDDIQSLYQVDEILSELDNPG